MICVSKLLLFTVYMLYIMLRTYSHAQLDWKFAKCLLTG